MLPEEIKSYLKRINFQGDLSPSLKLLTQLQRTHLLHIPFENLDVAFGIPIELDIDKIYSKVIENNRGGFCFELNELFHGLLKGLGFQVSRISARIYKKGRGYDLEFGHMANLVRIKGKEYLTDVGFGEFAFAPLILQMDIIQKDERASYKISQQEDGYFRVDNIGKETTAPEYIFYKKMRSFQDFSEMCHYHQTNPNSAFTQKTLITRPTIGGRITLTAKVLKIKSGDQINETPINSKKEFKEQLLTYFGIENI